MRPLTFGLLIIVLSSFSFCRRANPVSLDSRLPAQQSLRNLTVKIDRENHEIQAFDSSQNRILLRLNLNETFATVRRSDDKVSVKSGAFTMAEDEKERCDLLQLMDSRVDTLEITLHGRLQCGPRVTDIDLKFRPEADRVLMTLKPHEQRFNRIRFRFFAEDNEHVFAGAVRSGDTDLRARKIRILHEAIEHKTGHVPAFFITSAMRAFDTPQTAYQEWDFSAREFSVEIWDNSLQLTLSTADNFEKLIASYYNRLGQQPLKPDWTMGPMLALSGGREKIDAAIDGAGKAGNIPAAIWIQDLFTGVQGIGAEPDQKKYPDLKNWVQSLRQKGIRVLASIYPLFPAEGKLFAEAKAQSYIIRNTRYEPYKMDSLALSGFLADLSNPRAQVYIRTALRLQLQSLGLAGYVPELGGGLPWDSQLQSTEPAAIWHNRYAAEWEKLSHEAVREAGLEGRAAVITPAAWIEGKIFQDLNASAMSGLMPYLINASRETAKTGLPLARPLFVHYPHDHNTFNLSQQVMLGQDLIFPLGRQDSSKEQKVYLPKGAWIDSVSGTILTGPQWHNFKHSAPKPLLFIRQGAAGQALLTTALK